MADGRARVLDVDFIAEHTSGFDALAANLRAESWALLEAESGLSHRDLCTAADVYAQARSTIICWGMGITQHQHSVMTIQMLLNLLLLRGNLGRPGAGACPVRGHSNVQGDRTMGIDENPSPAFLDRLQQVFGFDPPRQAGLNTVDSIAAMHGGRARVFFGMGGNFAAATPDTATTWAGLRQCALTVHVTTKFNRSHVVHGKRALILPCLGRTEIDVQTGGPQSVSVEDSMSMVHLSAGLNAPVSEHLLSEPMIVARMALATLPKSNVPWAWLVEDYSRIRDKIEAVFDDFHGFNARVAEPGGFRLRNTASERLWKTASGKAEFRCHALPQGDQQQRARAAAAKGVVVMTLATVRSHDQYNTTIYGLDDRYRGVYGQRRVVFMNEADMQAQGFKAGDIVHIQSVFEGETPRQVDGFLLVAYDIPRGCLASYYPETNALLPLSSVADRAGTPTSKAIPVVLLAAAPLLPAAHHSNEARHV
jgi:molybdopterin-dependent oxidoreductase alpha subunit